MRKRQTKQKYHKVRNVLTIETLLQTQTRLTQVGGFLLFPAPIKLTAMIQLKYY
jgi:hypothetical protein